jgi:hypothetical protein
VYIANFIRTNENDANHGNIFHIEGYRGFPAGVKQEDKVMLILFTGIIGQKPFEEWVGCRGVSI